jgi:hypothetical protein
LEVSLRTADPSGRIVKISESLPEPRSLEKTILPLVPGNAESALPAKPIARIAVATKDAADTIGMRILRTGLLRAS